MKICISHAIIIKICWQSPSIRIVIAFALGKARTAGSWVGGWVSRTWKREQNLPQEWKGTSEQPGLGEVVQNWVPSSPNFVWFPVFQCRTGWAAPALWQGQAKGELRNILVPLSSNCHRLQQHQHFTLKLLLPHLHSQPFLYATVMAFRQINILHASQGCHMLFSIFPLVPAPVKPGNKEISLTCLASKIDFRIHLLIIGRFADSKLCSLQS